MADLNDLVKGFKEIADFLEKTANKATKTKSSLDPVTKSVKSLASAMFKATETADDLTNSFDNLTKIVDKSDFDVFVKGTSSFKSFSKEVQEAEKKISDFYGEVEKSIRLTKYLSVESSEYLDTIKKVDQGISDMSNSLQEKRGRLESVKKSMGGLDGNLKDLKKSLLGMEKSGALSFFNNMKVKLTELKGAVSDQNAFASFEKKIKDLDGLSVDKLPEEMKKIEAEFGKLKFDNNVLSKAGITKLGNSLSGGMRKTFYKIEKESNVGAEEIAKNLDLITETDSFKVLSSESQNFINGFIGDLRRGTIPFDDLEKKMAEFSSVVEQLSGQEADTIKKNLLSVAEKTKEGIDLHQNLNKMLEKPKLLSVALGFETSKIDDTIRALEEKSNLVGLSGEEQKNLDVLVKQKTEISSQLGEVEKLTAETLKHGGAEGEVLGLQKKITAQNNRIIKQSKVNNALAQRYLKIMDDVEKGTAGEQKVQKISDGLVEAHGHLNKYKEYMDSIGGGLEGMLGGLAGKLGGAMKGIGDGLMKYKSSLGIISSLVGALETVIKVDTQVKKAFKEVANSGVLVGVSAGDMKGQLDKVFKAANNVGGLVDAMRGVRGAVSLGKDEIIGMGNAITSSGMSFAQMEKQTHSMNKGLKESESGIRDAAEMTHVLGSKMGKSDAEMGSMVGDLAYQYGSTLQGIKDGFSDVATAAQQSSMGANKFMGIVQAATAGMALYDDQIVDTARSLAKMKGIGLTGAEMGKAAKSSAEFAQDPKKVMTAIGMVLSKEGGKEQIQAMADKMADKMEGLRKQAAEAKAKGTPEGDGAAATLTQEADNLSEGIANMRSAAEGNADALSDASQMFKTFPAEVQQNLTGAILDFFKKSAGTGTGSKTIFAQTAEQAGLDPALVAQELKTRGKTSEGLMGTATGQGKEATKEGYQKLLGDVAEQDQLTSGNFAKVIDALKNDFIRIFGGWTTIFAGILTALIALQTYMMAKSMFGGGGGGGMVKTLKSLFVKGGGALEKGAEVAKGGGGMMSKVLDGAKGMFSAGGEGGGFAKTLGKSIKPLKLLGAGAKVLGKFMGPVGLALAAGDAIGGWNDAGELSGKGDKATTGDKFKGALSGLVEGLTFGILDKQDIFNALPGGGPDKLAPTAIAPPKTAALGQPTTSGANPMSKSGVNTEKIIKEVVSKSPYAITQHFHGVTDKNFYDQVKVAMLKIEQERNAK